MSKISGKGFSPQNVRADIEHQLEIIASGSQGETVAARRELEKILYSTHRESGAKRSVFTKEFCETLIARLRTIPDATHQAKYFSAIARMALYFGEHSRDPLFDLMFEKILDPNARVRGVAVTLAQSLRLLELFTDKEEEDDLQRVEILLRIKKLIRKHAPHEWFSRDEMDLVYVRSLPASIVKSLLYLWDACANAGVYSEEFIEQHPECLPGMPLRWWDDSF